MLTENDKALLERAFAGEASKELSVEQADGIAARTKIGLRMVEAFALEKGIVPCRYQRNVGSIGVEGQRELLGKKVIIVGLGGLGGYVLEELARAGVGQITGVDPDVFDETNLNRQLLCEEGNLGKEKVSEAQKRLRKINKAVELEGFAVPLDKLTDEIWRDADLVFDCLDNIEDRLKLVNKCSAANVPLVHGAIAGWYGQVGVVRPGAEMLAKIYKSHKGVEENTGTPPFTAAVAASVMAAKGIKLLTRPDPTRKEELLLFDLLEDDWQKVTFS
jgi:molybdopterin/thiamine biosynthesis adenylyltransferase